MPDEKQLSLPEQYYKSRLTALLTSVAAFGVSVATPNSLGSFPIMGAKIDGLNQPFLVIALLTASFVSLVSLWLSYRNEGVRYVASRLEPIQKAAIADEFEGQIQDLTTRLDKERERLLEIVNDHQWQDAIEKGRAIPRARQLATLQQALVSKEEITALVDSAIRDADNNNLVDYMDDIVIRDRVRASLNIIHNRLLDFFGEHVEAKFNQIPMKTMSDQLEWILSHFESEHEHFTASIARLKDIPHAQRQILKRSEAHIRWEVKLWGLGVPLAVFVISLLHGIGALGFKLGPSLPEIAAMLFPGSSG